MKLAVETNGLELAGARAEVAAPRGDGFVDADLPEWPEGAAVRIWIVGCGSPARVGRFLKLVADRSPGMWNLKSRVFATDSSRRRLEAVRLAVAPDPSARRLPDEAEMFARPLSESSGTPLPHAVFTSLVFAEHDVLHTPPLARLDCIYFARSLGEFTAEQAASIFDLFHYALREGGRLLLHAEEGPVPGDRLFEPVAGRRGVYVRMRHEPTGGLPPLAVFGSIDKRQATTAALGTAARQAVLNEYGPPTVLVDAEGRIVYARDIPQRWKTEPNAEPTSLAPKAARAVEKAAAAARKSGRTVVRRIVDPTDRRYAVRLRAKPLEPSMRASDLVVVFFEQAEAPAAGRSAAAKTGRAPPTGSVAAGSAATAGAATVGANGARRRPIGGSHLRHPAAAEFAGRPIEHWDRLEADYQRATAELEAYQVEFQATYEELQARNEELQIAEQSLELRNEELSRINERLRQSVDSLENSHDDVTNLLRNTDQVMLVLDSALRIQYFNRSAAELFGIPAGGVGRPLGELAWRFDDERFLAVCGEVVERLDPRRCEATTADGRFLLLKIGPYRARDRRVTGVVITGADLTEVRQAGLRQALLATVLLDSPFAVIVFDGEGRIVTWNEGAERIYGFAAAAMLGTPIETFLSAVQSSWVQGSLVQDSSVEDSSVQGSSVQGSSVQGSLVQGGASVPNGAALPGDTGAAPSDADEADLIRQIRSRVVGLETVQKRSDGRRIVVSITASPVRNRNGQVVAHSVIVRDITSERELEQAALDAATAEQRRIGRELHDGIGQELTGLGIQAGTLVEALKADEHTETAIAQTIYDGVRRTLGEVRALSKGLIPIDFEEGNLGSALAALVERLPKPRDCEVRFQWDGRPPVEHPAVAVQIYRIAQEAITNALKHSRARTIDVSLTTSRRRIVLRVVDDGIGIDEHRLEEGVGIATMHYRASLIKAAFSLARNGRRGTAVVCTLDDKQVV